MKPLTIDELKALPVGDWVWLIFADGIYEPRKGYFQKAKEIIGSIFLDGRYVQKFFSYSDYGTKWLAYKNKEQAETKSKSCSMCQDDILDAYVPVSPEGDICEKSCAPGEEWVYHANYCPNCGRRLISEEAEHQLAELKGEKI